MPQVLVMDGTIQAGVFAYPELSEGVPFGSRQNTHSIFYFTTIPHR
jgi:hypothetical protein